jgi:hypothetical protein
MPNNLYTVPPPPFRRPPIVAQQQPQALLAFNAPIPPMYNPSTSSAASLSMSSGHGTIKNTANIHPHYHHKLMHPPPLISYSFPPPPLQPAALAAASGRIAPPPPLLIAQPININLEVKSLPSTSTTFAHHPSIQAAQQQGHSLAAQ